MMKERCQPAADGSGKSLIPNEVVHALIQHFDEHDLSNASVACELKPDPANVKLIREAMGM